jgi:hypothetical protein
VVPQFCLRTGTATRPGLHGGSRRAADSYLVKRGKGKTIVAGYPWFTDWGRDTFISLRGICLATGRFSEARDILHEWANVVSEGMLPNRFPDQGDEPEYNSVDASLWYIVAVHDFLQAAKSGGGAISPFQKKLCKRPSTRFLPAIAMVRDMEFTWITTVCSPRAYPESS